VNFLAHLHLSGDSREVRVGNFMGDFVKGNAKGRFSSEIYKGISLHRYIDEFTDSHPVVWKSKLRLREKYRHYSGVIVDIFYDHFLAKNWNKFHHKKLEVFAEESYSIIKEFHDILPSRLQQILPYIIRQNWLVSYSTVSGIGQALFGMSHRTKFDSKMDESVKDLEIHYQAFNEEFLEFYPELVVRCQQFLS